MHSNQISSTLQQKCTNCSFSVLNGKGFFSRGYNFLTPHRTLQVWSQGGDWDAHRKRLEFAGSKCHIGQIYLPFLQQLPFVT